MITSRRPAPQPCAPADYGVDEFTDDRAEDCGRFFDGELIVSCSQAGTEFCEFECLFGGRGMPHRREDR